MLCLMLQSISSQFRPWNSIAENNNSMTATTCVKMSKHTDLSTCMASVCLFPKIYDSHNIYKTLSTTRTPVTLNAQKQLRENKYC